ncbi:PaaI family thioesterase [Rhodococcus sp. IEGM 1366]|uniref:PaaI family thioesterase n=1 Tax=Rhodococcus sp. IEGM 1366 TaxID=3082223 RepID=UPI002955B2BE|nr:PaaI family thioesterase [Rhodococcus sp. IEGM 1366]MDV8069373.1 PaaI family thioesterase [Rhodococcus sp. IEGM 1366]
MARIDRADVINLSPIDDAADGLRRLTDLLLRVDENDPALVAVADELDRIEAALEQNAGPVEFRDPVSGRGNALAPPLDLERLPDGTVRATGSLGLPYQGPQGLVHGGMSALMLDHILGLTHPEGSTLLEELVVRYHQPLPLFEGVVITGCRMSDEDEKVRARGEITVDGYLAVSGGGGVHFTTPPHRRKYFYNRHFF